MRRVCTHLGLAGLAPVLWWAGAWAATALAASSPVITDCVAHGQLTQTYSIQQLHHALLTLGASTRQYTDCSDVITRALGSVVGATPGSGTGGGGSGSLLPTPVIVILVLLLLAAITFGAVAVRRRRGDAPSA